MAGNHFDGPVGIDNLTDADSYFTWGWDAATQSFIGPRIILLTVNPTAGAGVVAPVGTLGMRYDAGNVSLWQKTAAGNTSWVNVGTISGGPLFPTSIDTTGTAAFQWTMADAQAAAVSFGAAGALNMLVFSTLNGQEQIQINAANGLRLADGCQLEFGTPGTDVIFTPDGTGVTVTGTGTIDFATDFQLRFGTGLQWLLERDGAGALVLSGPTSVNANSDSLLISTPNATSTTAGRTSGGLTIASGSTDSGGFAAGNSGNLLLQSGNAADTGTQGSGASGTVTLRSGTSADQATGDVTVTTGQAVAGNSGNLILGTGLAGATRGSILVQALTVDLTGQATAFLLRDNADPALTIGEGAGAVYVQCRTLNAQERVNIGSRATAALPSVQTTIDSNDIETNGTDHGGRFLLTEEFAQRPEANAAVANATANKNFELLPSAATVNVPASTLYTGGGSQITTAAVAINDGAVCRPHLDANQSAWEQSTWGSSLGVVGKFTFRTFENTDVRYEMGFRPTPDVFDDATDNEKVMLRFDSTDGVVSNVNWVLVVSAGGVDVTTNTGIAAAANASLNFYVNANPNNRQVSAYLDRVRLADPALNVLAAGVSIGKPYMAVQSKVGAGGTRRMVCRRLSASMVVS